ncbi:MAG TPA: transglycosylase family protein [Solirubrobacterales bacterium]|nr:transglycosylase family protein [Solirubrobacterales bacterium]
MTRTLATRAGACGLCCALVCMLTASGAIASGVGTLRSRLAAARGEASSLASQLQAAQGELAAAEGQAAAAGARERRLGALLAHGEERAAGLEAKVRGTERRLAAERRRLHRARVALGDRLVAIYESGSPSAAGVVLEATNFSQLATQAGYLEQIEQSDSALAGRVEAVRGSVARELKQVAALKARVDAYNERLAAARSEIASVRASAEAAAARLHSLAVARTASLATLKSKISTWVGDIQAAEAASRAEAEGEVERWLGGPYSIPAYIVMCESGGNYGAVNPSSGAGGAYQILPSTWELYGGQGAPQEASKSEQDRIAAEIWADSGPGAWVCG